MINKNTNKNLTLDDRVFLIMNKGGWWTFWELRKIMGEHYGKWYGEPTISASIRNLRKEPARLKYRLSKYDEVVFKKRIENGRGYKYKLAKVETI